MSTFCPLLSLTAISLPAFHIHSYFNKIKEGNSILRPIHYFPILNPDAVPSDAVRAAEHGDINLITLLMGASAWYLNLRLMEILPIRSEDNRLVELIDRPSTAVVLVAVALAPAICEEVLFRGVLVRGLATRFIVPFAILIAALIFSLYHLRIVQLVPTFTLGLPR